MELGKPQVHWDCLGKPCSPSLATCRALELVRGAGLEPGWANTHF